MRKSGGRAALFLPAVGGILVTRLQRQAPPNEDDLRP
jgi:hypothetical protein